MGYMVEYHAGVSDISQSKAANESVRATIGRRTPESAYMRARTGKAGSASLRADQRSRRALTKIQTAKKKAARPRKYPRFRYGSLRPMRSRSRSSAMVS